MADEPKVYLDYTQRALDDAFEQNVWAPNFEELRDKNKVRCAAVRANFEHFERRYGEGAQETLEIVPAKQTNAPVLLFVHGGRWRPQPDNAFVYFADTVATAGAHLAAARFSTLDPPKLPTRMPDMIAELRRAVAWLHANAASFGGDPNRIHVIGHSSGGHLTSVLLTTDWTKHGLPADVFKSGTCVSGMYELRPVLLSARSAYVKLTPEEEDEFSAIRHMDRLRCPVTIAYGSKESPEFQRQGRTFAAALRARGAAVQELILDGLNHFEGIRSMIEPQSPLARQVLGQLGLRTPP
ncbi:MAG TPA: alpha/beta hydrolase [Stellaceae bacterium]|jgi:arylformamidase|nr:alpha/beta hydrolase [Stellaceae bacterium]